MRDEYYTILGIDPGASPRDIRRAYWERAKKCHPDVNPQLEAAEQFIRLNHAYHVLTQGTPLPPDLPEAPHHRSGPQRERAAEYARQQYEAFRQNNAQFKRSPWYLPTRVFTYFAWWLGNLGGAAFLLSPLWITYLDGHTRAGLAMIPFALLGLLLIAAAYQFKREVEKYF